MDMTTGQFFKRGDNFVLDRRELTTAEEKVAANELWVDTIYDPDDVQGNPRWLGAELDVQNNRLAAESANDYLEQGGVPLCLVAVQGGNLDTETFDRLNFALKDAQASHPENRMIIVEVVPTKSDAGPIDGGQVVSPKIEVTKLNDLQRSDDSMFLQLRARGTENVLQPFRLNSLFLGKNNDQSFATANVSMQLGESQVFAPERNDFDWFINNRILPELGASWWTFKSNGPKLEDNTSWVEVLRVAIEYGAIPDYQTLRAILAEVLDYELPTGDDAGNVAEWEKLPPGFVKALVTVVQGIPAFADLQDTLAGVGIGPDMQDALSEGHPDVAMVTPSERSVRTLSSRQRSATLVDRVAGQVVQIMMRARARLAGEAARDA
jgi:capsid portal protein